MPRFLFDYHEVNLVATHSYRLSADVSIRQDHAEDSESRDKCDIEMSVSYTPYQGKTVAFDWSGQRSLATRQTISRKGIDVEIVERPN